MRKMKMFAAGIALVFAVSLAAQEFKVAVPQLSPLSTDSYKALATAVLEATGAKANVQVLPFARCVNSIENKEVDLVSTTVALPDQKKWAALKYDYSTTEAVKIVFVLYLNKAKSTSLDKLRNGDLQGLKLETDSAHTGHFPFAIAPSTSVDASLKKVDSGDIDGFIFSQPTTDAALKRLGYANIKRYYYATFLGMFLLPKGGRGGALDKKLTEGLQKIRQSGKYTEIMGELISGASAFKEWQP
jgi:polar amino acid transport system substrate-binding protein